MALKRGIERVGRIDNISRIKGMKNFVIRRPDHRDTVELRNEKSFSREGLVCLDIRFKAAAWERGILIPLY